MKRKQLKNFHSLNLIESLSCVREKQLKSAFIIELVSKLNWPVAAIYPIKRIVYEAT